MVADTAPGSGRTNVCRLWWNLHCGRTAMVAICGWRGADALGCRGRVRSALGHGHHHCATPYLIFPVQPWIKADEQPADGPRHWLRADRKSVVSGKRVSVRLN